MSARRTPILVHLLGAAAASALLAYWGLKLFESPGAAPPAPPAQALTREPDAALAGRMFGDVGGAPVVAVNVQLNGVYAAGRASSAVVSVDGKPQRAVLLGQELSAGVRLTEVRPDGVTLEQGGTRTQLSVPAPVIARSTAPVPGYRREGATLTAPSVDVPDANRNPGGPAPAPGGGPLGGPLSSGFQQAGVPGRVPAENLLPRRNPGGGAQGDRPGATPGDR